MSNKLKLLIVEDEDAILQGLTDLFVFNGYEVDSRTDGKEGLEAALSGTYDAVLLDVMLPSMDGFSICNALRQHSREQIIIMLTAKNAEDDIINGLSLGADDYIAKPFSVRELVLRVESVLRRSGRDRTDAELSLSADIVINTQTLEGEVRGETVLFTRREIEILQLLQRQNHRPVGRTELLAEVWGYKQSPDLDTRTVDIHIAKLRKKIEVKPKSPTRLVTVRGEGYRLVVS